MNVRKIAAHALTAAVVAGGVVAVAAPAMAYHAGIPQVAATRKVRSSVSWNSDGRYAMACYPSDFTLLIQVRLTDDQGNQQVVPRIVDWTQCNVAQAGGTWAKIEVSGQIDGFQNEWHEVD